MISYDTLPFKTFHQILTDEAKNLHLLGIDDEKKAKKVWEEIKEEWTKRHPSAEERELLTLYRQALSRTIKLSKTIAAIRFVLISQDEGGEMTKFLFEKIRAKWSEDQAERLENMSRMLNKAKDEKEIYDARLKKLAEKLKENRKSSDKRVIEMTEVNKSIASLELAGFTIDDYDKLTCGKYDAMASVIKEQGKKRQNGNR